METNIIDNFDKLRIDNQLHDGKPGVHVHKKGYVQWLDITFEEAEELIERYADEN